MPKVRWHAVEVNGAKETAALEHFLNGHRTDRVCLLHYYYRSETVSLEKKKSQRKSTLKNFGKNVFFFKNGGRCVEESLKIFLAALDDPSQHHWPCFVAACCKAKQHQTAESIQRYRISNGNTSQKLEHKLFRALNIRQ